MSIILQTSIIFLLVMILGILSFEMPKVDFFAIFKWIYETLVVSSVLYIVVCGITVIVRFGNDWAKFALSIVLSYIITYAIGAFMKWWGRRE